MRSSDLDNELQQFIADCAEAAAMARRSAEISENDYDRLFWVELAGEWEKLASEARSFVPIAGSPPKLVRPHD
jgi:hypothetical protein